MRKITRNGQSGRPGWTLVEILVVLAIIGILAGLSFYGITSSINYADKIEREAKAAAIAGPSYKISVPIAFKGGRPEKQNRPKHVPNQYVVRLNPTAGDPKEAGQKLADDFKGKLIRVIETEDDVVVGIESPYASVDSLKKHELVASAGKNTLFYATVESVPTGVRRLYGTRTLPFSKFSILLPFRLSNRNFQGGAFFDSGPAIAILDTGVDNTHPDLNVVFSRSYVTTEPFITGDPHGHGTHVAGSAAARENGDGVLGVAPGAPIWNFRVLDSAGAGTTLDIIDALDGVSRRRNFVKIANMSLGGGLDDELDAAVNKLAARGVFVVVAAGNDGADADAYSPARASGAICIGAISDSDGKPGALGPDTSDGKDDTFATFSNYGFHLEYVMPGTDILSTYPGNQYAVLSGTSMAAPHMAGYLAILQDSRTGIAQSINNISIPQKNPTTRNQVQQLVNNLGFELILGTDSRYYKLPQPYVNLPPTN